MYRTLGDAVLFKELINGVENATSQWRVKNIVAIEPENCWIWPRNAFHRRPNYDARVDLKTCPICC